MYKFRFESILRHRGNVEKTHILDMSKLQTILSEEERVLSLTVDQVRKILTHIAKVENKGVCSNEISMYRTFLGGARASMSEQEKKIINIQELIESKRLQLLKASKEKKVLEKFKQKKKQKFLLELKKREQKEMDAVAAKRSLEV